jgi:hypothetical protein
MEFPRTAASKTALPDCALSDQGNSYLNFLL